MGSFLELSKIVIATYLHDKWKETYGVLKLYMTLALITLSLITSVGIYGLLSTGFSTNIAKLKIGQKEVKNIEIKKQRFEEIKNEYQKEKQIIDSDVSKMREALSNNTTLQSVDKKTGLVITKANKENRKAFETQLELAIQNRDKMSGKIEQLNDSITNIDIKILEMESSEISGNELGTIKYISQLTGWSVEKTANIFILMLIFVFDPLAITLVIATSKAFRNIRNVEKIPLETTEEINQIEEKPKTKRKNKTKLISDKNLNITELEKNNKKEEEQDSPKEILKVDKNVEFKENNTPKQEVTPQVPQKVEEEVNVLESLLDITEPIEEETPEEIISNNTEEIQTIINRRLSYTKNDTGNFKINRI